MRILARLLLVVVVALLATVAVRAMLRAADLNDQALSEARRQTAALDSLLQGTDRVLTAAGELAAASTVTGVCDIDFGAITFDSPLYPALAAFDVDGRLMCGGGLRSLPRADSRHLLQAAAAAPGSVTGEFAVIEPGHRRVLPVARASRGPDGRVTAVAVTLIDLEQLASHLARVWRLDNATVTLADHNGVILVRLPFHGSWAGRKLPEDVMRVVQRDRQGNTSLDLGTGNRVEAIGFAPLATSGNELFVTVAFHTTTALGDVKRVVSRSLVPATLLALAAGLVVVALPRSRRSGS